MPLIANEFVAGQIAESASVNANFDAIEGAVGENSTDEVLDLPGYIQLGPRDNSIISADPDESYSSDSFLHLGWNARPWKDGGTWKVERVNDGEQASGIRIGRYGIAFYTALNSRATGDLNAQWDKVFDICRFNGNEIVYYEGSFVNDVSPTTLQHYRLTYTGFDDPVAVYEDSLISVGTKTRTAASYGVPETARAIEVVGYARANTGEATLKIMQARATPETKHGFGVKVAPSDTTYFNGKVHLGLGGSYDGKFVEVRTNTFAQASLYIKGYYE